MTTVDIEELLENLAQCRRCGICRNAVYEDKGFDGVCPVWKNSAGFETSFMRCRIQVALALLDGRLEKTEENAESLFTCTLCGNCTSICAAEFDPAKCLESVRQVLNEIPNEARDTIAKKILENNNPYVDDNKTRRDWVKGVGFDIPRTGEVLYFTGCTAGLKSPETAKSTAKVLKAAGVDFAVLEEEPCCGSVMIRTGMVKEAKQNAEKALEMIAKSGAKQIVVTCAGCLKTLREDYTERCGLDLPEVLHVVEYLKPLIESGKLKLKKSAESKKITWHDPCHLGRALGIYEEPRDVLKAIPGVELVEMGTNREAAMCCGSGGGLRSYDGDLAKRIAADRMKDAEEIGVDILATACPFCEHNLKDGAEGIGSKIEVVDILDLLAQQLE
ncbi:MAG: (Fe-S)-binding protein [Candidatus Thorarchaeota archaeon]|nr:MAG: (Fe-S)-binding protein [Candidatus Thorarchaeota archaeon]